MKTIGFHHKNHPQPQRQGAPAYYYFTNAQLMVKRGNINEAIWLLNKSIEHDSQSVYLKLELVNLLLARNDEDKSLAIVKSVLDKQPGHVEALSLAGTIYYLQNKIMLAEKKFEKAIETGKAKDSVFLHLGRIYWSKNDYDSAERVFSLMAKQFPDSYAAHYFEGMVFIVQGKQPEAEVSFLKSLTLEPAWDKPRYELLRIYKDQKRLSEIEAVYKDLLIYNPADYQAAFQLVVHYRNIGKNKEALLILRELGSRSPSEPDIVSVSIEQYLETRQYALAAWIYKGLLAGEQKNSDLHYLLGVSLVGIKKDQAALEYFENVKPESRFYNEAVVNRSLLHHNMGKINRAIAVLKQGLKHDDKKVDYYLYLGTFYEELERYQEAVGILKQGLKLDKRNSMLHYRLGVVYDKMELKKDSIEIMKKVLRLKPDNAEALNYLGYTYADMGINLDEAVTLIHSALELKPDDGYIADSMGWVYYKRGQYSLALKYLIKAASLVPDDPVILEHLGDVHVKMDNSAEALNYYRRSLDKSSKNKKAIENKINSLKTK
ncbi:MAG: tetratricopeptide repeat protein [Desulfobacteraceae bacterium]|nr:tetratricopeptide repeat protein [Desulfobacteraceae bacterium]